MPRETTIRLIQSGTYSSEGLNKHTYTAEVIGGMKNWISILSTNHLEGHQIVLMETPIEEEELDLTFEVDGQIVDSALPISISPGILEFYLTTAEVRQEEEESAYSDHNQFSLETARREEALTEQDRLEAPEADDQEIPLIYVVRNTYPGQDKPDNICFTILSPFTYEGAGLLVNFNTELRYAKADQNIITSSTTPKRGVLFINEHSDPDKPIQLTQDIPYSASITYELILTITEVSTGSVFRRIITSDEVGAAQVIPMVPTENP